jgi:nicotinate-nucleotide adenylyltransferase
VTAKRDRKGPGHNAAFTPSPPPFGDRRRRRVGILGGSFNPAHEGHLHISREALKRLGLHQVWWLVSPQNPLKPTRGMATLDTRLAAAKDAAHGDRGIVVSALEQRLGETRTALTLKALTRRYPALRFVWLMGADNLAQMPRWWRWTRIFHTARVAVFDRNPYSYGALAGAAARRFVQARTRRPSSIWFRLPPSWTYVAIRRHPASATALRGARQKA